MSLVKQQHFVPRFFLKNISGHDKYISLYNILGKIYIPNASIKNQCCKNYLYDTDNKIENYLSQIEGNAAKAIKQILSSMTLPDIDKNYIQDIHDDFDIRFFIANQSQRTIASFEDMQKMLLPPIQAVYNMLLHTGAFPEPPKLPDGSSIPLDMVNISLIPQAFYPMLIENAKELVCQLFDLKMKLLTTDGNFIISDNPVIKCCPIAPNQGAGFGTLGIIIFLPLSSQICLTLYDSMSYHFGQKSKTIIKLSKKQLDEINSLQIMNAEENLYFCSSVTKDYIESFDVKPIRRVGTQQIGPYFISSNYSIPLSDLSGLVKIKEKMKKLLKRGSVPVGIQRDQELCDMIKHYQQINRKAEESEQARISFVKFLLGYYPEHRITLQFIDGATLWPDEAEI